MRKKIKNGVFLALFVSAFVNAQNIPTESINQGFSGLENMIADKTIALTADKETDEKNGWKNDGAAYYKVYKDSDLDYKSAIVRGYLSKPTILTAYFFDRNELKKIKLIDIVSMKTLELYITENGKYMIQGEESLLYMPVEYLYNQGLVAFEKSNT